MHTDFTTLPLRLAAAFLAAVFVAAPAQAQRVEVCALVACNASGQRAAAFAQPERSSSATPSSAVRPPTAPDRSAPAAPPRDPWARRFQGRDADDDVCLLNVGLNGQLARKGTFDTHVLGRTQAWRGPQR